MAVSFGLSWRQHNKIRKERNGEKKNRNIMRMREGEREKREEREGGRGREGE